ncbi:MAG: 2'-5' RNA ligase family protein [Verrucomicrobiota bacterium]
MKTVYWLMPAEPARSFFAAQIDALAREYDAPVFAPHVTLCATPAGLENPAAVLRRALVGAEPVRLRVRGIDCSDAFTKTVFVQFQESPRLAEWTRTLRDASGCPDEDAINPHLSLLYRQMPLARKQKIADTIILPFAEVVFDSVQAVRCGAEVQTRADVESWRAVATQSLPA